MAHGKIAIAGTGLAGLGWAVVFARAGHPAGCRLMALALHKAREGEDA
jgi:3-hydroxyacyl-CoA dehydrogenase